MFDHIAAQKRSTILLSVDLKSAYDGVSNQKLYELLENTGLAPE